MQLSRYLPLVGTLILVAIVFLWRPWLQRRRHGNWGIVVFKGGLAQKARDAMLVVSGELNPAVRERALELGPRGRIRSRRDGMLQT